MSISEAYKAFDATIAGALKESADKGRPCTCSKGCFACCKEPVYTSRAEARYLLGLVPPEEIPALTVRVRRWVTIANASGALRDDPQPHVFLYRAVNLWCPLLKDGLCTVYARRPLACRGHNAAGDPANCHDEAKRLRQVWMFSPRAMLDGMQHLLEEPDGSSYDHLGCWLAELLLGKKVPSAAAESIDVHQQGDCLVVRMRKKPSTHVEHFLHPKRP